MNRLLVSNGGVWLVLYVQACGGAMATSEPNGSGGEGHATRGGSTSGPVGGSQTGPNAGTNQSGPAGGSGATSNGGFQVGPVGGSTANSQGGNTGRGGTGSTGYGGTGSTGYGGTGSTGYGGTGSTGYGGTGSTGYGGTGSTGYGGTGSTGYGGTGSTGYGGTGSTGYGGTGSTGYGGATGSATLITSAEGAYWKVETATDLGPTGSDDVTVYTGATGSTWDGFGGVFNELGWNYLSMLSVTDRERAMQLLFGNDGARFAFGRIPIGASDYAMDRYTLDEIPKETPTDYAMEKFSIDRDKQNLIPYIKAALAVKSTIRFWASPWTPPTWMKDNGSFDGGNMKDDMQTLSAYALYLAKFVEEYRKENIAIEAVHVQNEPSYAQDYPSCLWSAALTTRFISRYLGPTFGERNVNALIYLGTMANAENGKDGTIISSVTADATAMSYVKGFGLQWNMLGSASGLKSRNLPIVQTAHQPGNYPWSSNFVTSKAPNDHAYAVESWGLIRDWIKAGATSYSAWNMVLDTVGKNMDTVRPWPQNALLTVDASTKTLNVTPAYYVFRHVSQFVAPGAKVFPTNANSGDALAFKNPDGTVVTILYNSGAAKSLRVAVNGRSLRFAMPGNGWATIYLKN